MENTLKLLIGISIALACGTASADGGTMGLTGLSSYRGKVSDRDFRLLERAQQTLLRNIIVSKDAPTPWHPLRCMAPSVFGYDGVWPWDASFHAVGVSRWDPVLAREQLQVILDNQQESGDFFNVYRTDGEILREPGQPPVYPWAAMLVDQRAPDTKFLAKAYPIFKRYEKHWTRDRRDAGEVLFHYAGPEPFWESGWDTSVRWDHREGRAVGCSRLWPVDLNCYVLMMYRSLAYMAHRLNLEDERVVWDRKAKILAGSIQSLLWDAGSSCYYDRDRKTRAFNRVLTPASFMPLYVRIADSSQADKMRRLAADPKKLFPGMPSAAYDDPQYKSSDYWRGPTWMNIAYFALKGLKQYGFDEVADRGRERMLDWVADNDDYFYEYYDSRTGKGCGVKQYGWTATFVMEFILNWDKETRPADHGQ